MICEEVVNRQVYEYGTDWTSSTSKLVAFDETSEGMKLVLLVTLEYNLKNSTTGVFELESVGISKNEKYGRKAEILSFTPHNDPNGHVNKNWSSLGDKRILVKSRKSHDYSVINSDVIMYRLEILLRRETASQDTGYDANLMDMWSSTYLTLRPKRPTISKSWGVYSDLKSKFGSWNFTNTIFQEICTLKHSVVMVMNNIAFYHFTGCTLGVDDDNILETLPIVPTKNLEYIIVCVNGDGLNDGSGSFEETEFTIMHTGDAIVKDKRRPLTILPFDVSFFVAKQLTST